MLKNIIFDMGNVLIRWDPEYFIRRAGIESPEDHRLLLNEIFRSADWQLLDSGELTESELVERVRLRLPERLHAAAHFLVFHWDKPLIPIPGMADFIRECRHAGLGVYLLTNAGYRQPEYWKNVPGSEYFDGTMVSAYQGWVKPSREIFEQLLERFRLKADECLFVDDVQENITAAQRLGIQGMLFSGDVYALRRAIFTVHINQKETLC